MPIRPSIDDTNTTLIDYQGEWDELMGSTRQWEGGVHLTTQAGASATFKFRGYQVWVWGTVPASVGTNIIDVSVDGSAPNVTSRTSNGSAMYNELYYESPLLRQTYHTVVVTNRGSDANGNTEFLLDRFEFESSDDVPVFTTTGTSTSAPTSASTTTPTTSSVVNGNSSPSGSKTPVGAIAGAVIGVLALVVCVLGYVLWRRKKGLKASEEEKAAQLPSAHPSNLTPTPFPIDATNSQSSTTPLSPPRHPEHQSSLNQISEKAGYQNPHVAPTSSHPTSNPAATTSSTTLDTAASSHPIASFPVARTDTSSPSPSNEAHVRPLPTSDVLSSTAATYDHPPPSYWHANPHSDAGESAS